MDWTIIWWILAVLIVIGGLAGTIIPALPGVAMVFAGLLLAAWAATRGSPELHRWLHDHPRFGPPLIAWETNRAVSVPAKWLACVLMTSSWVVMLLLTETWVVPAITGVMFVSVGGFLVTRPTA